MLSSNCHVTLRFRDIRFFEGQHFGFWGLLEVARFVSGTDMYHHVKFHADRCHRRRDICNRIHTQNYSRPNIRQNAY